jgi:hypothetical protein
VLFGERALRRVRMKRLSVIEIPTGIGYWRCFGNGIGVSASWLV